MVPCSIATAARVTKPLGMLCPFQNYLPKTSNATSSNMPGSVFSCPIPRKQGSLLSPSPSSLPQFPGAFCALRQQIQGRSNLSWPRVYYSDATQSSRPSPTSSVKPPLSRQRSGLSVSYTSWEKVCPSHPPSLLLSWEV